MAVHITSIQSGHNGNKAATGLAVTWEKGQFVMIICEKGVLSCGIVSPEVVEKFSFAFAIAHGSPGKPLVSAEDLLVVCVSEVSTAARALGVCEGMTGKQVIEKLS